MFRLFAAIFVPAASASGFFCLLHARQHSSYTNTMSTSTDFGRRNRFFQDDNMLHHPKNGISLKAIKRRRGWDDDYLSQPRQFAEQHKNKRKFLQERLVKRARTPTISGKNLPISRLVEVMDYSQLKSVLEMVMAQHPEVAQTIHKSAVKPSTGRIVELIKDKAARIVAHLPYKCDVESDYSYIRVKPYLTEFLDCISDFILNLLPPMEFVLANSCYILDVITNLIHELPCFSNSEFQYTKTIAYQQLANLWLIVLSHTQAEESEAVEDPVLGLSEPSLEWLKTVESMKLLEQMEKHNETSGGKFAAVVEHIKSELGTYAQANGSCSPEAAAPQGSIFNDLITVDYSNYSIAANASL